MDPLEGRNLVARWGFEADIDHRCVTGELLLRDDGVLLRRFGGTTEDGSIITWSYDPWVPVDGWTGERTITSAEQALRTRGYQLVPFGPVPIDEDRTEPFDTNPLGADPLQGANIVAHWGFVVDNDELELRFGGEALVRDDGVLLLRHGGSNGGRAEVTWSFDPWYRAEWWDGDTEVVAAEKALRRMGYRLHEPGPVPITESTAGPFEPDPPNHLL